MAVKMQRVPNFHLITLIELIIKNTNNVFINLIPIYSGAQQVRSAPESPPTSCETLPLCPAHIRAPTVFTRVPFSFSLTSLLTFAGKQAPQSLLVDI